MKVLAGFSDGGFYLLLDLKMLLPLHFDGQRCEIPENRQKTLGLPNPDTSSSRAGLSNITPEKEVSLEGLPASDWPGIYLWGVSFLLTDIGGANSSWAAAFSGHLVLGCIRQLAKFRSLQESQQAVLLHDFGFCLSSCPDLFRWWAVIWSIRINPFSPNLLLVRVFNDITEAELVNRLPERATGKTTGSIEKPLHFSLWSWWQSLQYIEIWGKHSKPEMLYLSCVLTRKIEQVTSCQKLCELTCCNEIWE